MKPLKGRKTKVRLNDVPCTCGGTLRPSSIKPDENGCDITDLLGFPALVYGDFGAVLCDRCGKMEFPGRMLELISREAVLCLLRQDRRLTGREAIFLRKEALGISRAEVSQRLGIPSDEVSDFENAEGLTARQDYDVRGLVVGRLLKESRTGVPRWKREQPQLVEISELVLGGARDVAAPKSPAPLRLAA